MYSFYKSMVKEKYDNYSIEELNYYTSKYSIEDYMLEECMEFSDLANGSNKEMHMPYVALKCLKHIDENCYKYALNKINDYYDKQIEKYGKADDICQRYLNYPLNYVKLQLNNLYNYQNNLIDENKVDEDILNITSYIEKLIEKESYSREDTQKILKTLQTLEGEFNIYCDMLEEQLKKIFSDELSDNLLLTYEKLEFQRGKVKILDGQKFDLLIHCSHQTYLLNKRDFNRGFSTSLINDENICCYKENAFKFAFYKVNSEDILSASSTDNFSNSFSKNGFFYVAFAPDFIPLRAFKEKTNKAVNSYSEINISVESKIRPDAIVCFDEVKLNEYELAKKHDLDIILIKTSSYKSMRRNKTSTRNF